MQIDLTGTDDACCLLIPSMRFEAREMFDEWFKRVTGAANLLWPLSVADQPLRLPREGTQMAAVVSALLSGMSAAEIADKMGGKLTRQSVHLIAHKARAKGLLPALTSRN